MANFSLVEKCTDTTIYLTGIRHLAEMNCLSYMKECTISVVQEHIIKLFVFHLTR